MNTWAARRFWTTARVLAADDGFAVHLDDRPVRTPAKVPLILPTEGLAQAIADEWQGVEGKVNPAVMPFTRMANSAIDKVTPQFDAVVAMLADYGGSDLICYRAEGPESLVRRQADAWDPLLDWVSTALNAPLDATSGIMHRAQPKASLQTLHRVVQGLTPFQLTAFHDLVAISGSLVLALAVTRGRLTAEAAWPLSRIDEAWQIEEWGEDEEAAEMAAAKHADFLQADRFYALCG
ncbi:MAG: ATPase [Rhodobacterales bacterium]|nr:ATPase [Rhodobacterales bacterium]